MQCPFVHGHPWQHLQYILHNIGNSLHIGTALNWRARSIGRAIATIPASDLHACREKNALAHLGGWVGNSSHRHDKDETKTTSRVCRSSLRTSRVRQQRCFNRHHANIKPTKHESPTQCCVTLRPRGRTFKKQGVTQACQTRTQWIDVRSGAKKGIVA